MFWRVVKKDFNLLAMQDRITLPDLLAANAILDLQEDTEAAINAKHSEDMDKLREK